MKYLGWFLFNVVVFIWSLVKSMQGDSWIKDPTTTGALVGVSAIVAGVGIVAFIIRWIWRLCEIIKDLQYEKERQIESRFSDLRDHIHSDHAEILGEIKTLKEE